MAVKFSHRFNLKKYKNFRPEETKNPIKTKYALLYKTIGINLK